MLQFEVCWHIPKSDAQWKLGFKGCSITNASQNLFTISHIIIITQLSASCTASNNSKRTETELRYESLTTENTVYSTTYTSTIILPPLSFMVQIHSLLTQALYLYSLWEKKDWRNYFVAECSGFSATLINIQTTIFCRLLPLRSLSETQWDRICTCRLLGMHTQHYWYHISAIPV